MMFFKLALKNIISRKTSIVIVLFIAFSVALLVLTNAIFDSTENGIQETFITSFTGDIVIRPKHEPALSLLGDESPVTGTFTEIPLLTPYEKINSYLKELPEVKLTNPQLFGMVALDYNGQKTPAALFGTETSDYLKMMSGIKIEKGQAYSENQKGIMLSTQVAELIGADVGSELQFIVAEGLSVRIRSAPVTAVYSYPVENRIFDDIIVISPQTVRELFEINSMYSAEDLVLDKGTQELLSDYDLDSLFDESDDNLDDFICYETVDADEECFAEDSFNDAAVISENSADTTWNFIICKLDQEASVKKTIKKMNRFFKKSGWNVEAVGWRNAAGNLAMYLYFLRLIFNIGIFIVLFAGFIIINNTLVINILDRTQEIGTMRAIGTSKLFVSLQCMSETFILAVAAGIIGMILGCIFSRVVLALHITFSNTFLIQLFGGNTLVTVIKASSLLKCFGVSLILGMVAWIYPVHTALNTSPVVAMRGAK